MSKLRQVNELYSNLMLEKLETVANVAAFFTQDHLRLPPQSGWENITAGQKWGGEWQNIWIKFTYTVPANAAGKTLYVRPQTNATETLCFVDNKPCGIINSKNSFLGGEHSAIFLTSDAKPGDTFELAYECYAGHYCVGTSPYDSYGKSEPGEHDFDKRFNGVDILVMDEDLKQMVYDLRSVLQIASLPSDNFIRMKAREALEKVYSDLIMYPLHYNDDGGVRINASVKKCIEDMKPVLALRENNDPTRGYVGVIGHSHMDTAWLWPVSETVRKCARTYSQVLNLMKRYPEYKFVQSSALHLDWMRQYYPDIFAEIKERVAEGRYEPNGGVWVECDCNVTSGELMARQFIYGQRFTREHMNYTSDSFWLPDTFGYNAAIPQIMLESGVKYFYTTKISWNDLNSFPVDTFFWKGLDGSRVLTHYNLMHTFPDVENIRRAVNEIKDKSTTDKKFLAFGFGDGGGGPTEGMIELARRSSAIEGMPKVEYSTISDFMQKIEASSDRLPEFSGELYLELHRGTLTQMHDIKRNNRKAELALRDMEFVNVYSGAKKSDKTDELYKVLLLNQFHDILPGTSLTCVNDLTRKEVTKLIADAKCETNAYASTMTESSDTSVTLVNTLSHERNDAVVLSDNGRYITGENVKTQRYTDVCGRNLVAYSGIAIAPLSADTFALTTNGDVSKKSAFTVKDDEIETPLYSVKFDKNGYIASLYDKKAKREVRRAGGNALGTLYIGEDVPASWDNWDIDSDIEIKLHPETQMISKSVVSDGEVELRVRTSYKVGERSKADIDVVFYADDARVDFHVLLDWNEKHTLLKAGFDVDIHTSTSKHEIQFGHIDRPTTRNNSLEAAKFEVCNHKWTDISENRYGVALLNDCKYGISVEGSDMRLSLHKGGCHPDVTGDSGVHEMTYSLLPHIGAMNAENVIRPSYELNIPHVAAFGSLKSTSESLAQISESNIICEAVKYADDKQNALGVNTENAYVMRLYESERAKTTCEITLSGDVKHVYSVNMLEEIKEELPVSGNKITVPFKPFEIKSIMVVR